MDAHDFPCDLCGAAKGERCLTMSVDGAVHVVRFERALGAAMAAAPEPVKVMPLAVDIEPPTSVYYLDENGRMVERVVPAGSTATVWACPPRTGVDDELAAARAETEAAKAALTQLRADALMLAGHWFGARGGFFIDVEGLTEAEAKALTALAYDADDTERMLAAVRQVLGGAR